jgi:hypothetical protein
MNTFNIWMRNDAATGPTGPWVYLCAVVAKTEHDAMKLAQQRFGYENQYQIYEGLGVR